MHAHTRTHTHIHARTHTHTHTHTIQLAIDLTDIIKDFFAVTPNLLSLL